MKTFKNNLGKLLLLFPAFLFAQQAPTLQELIDHALVNDGTLTQQALENKYTKLDDQKLKDVFLPKVEVSGKTGYLYASAHLKSPEFGIPAIPPIFPGAIIPEGQLNNNLNISGISAMAKAEATALIYSGGKVKYLKEANKEKNISENLLMQKSRDEIITEISKAYDQMALVQESKKVLDEAKKRLDINKKTADKALGYGLITPYDHKKIELAQATLDSKLVEYEGKKELLITQIEILTGIERERIALIQPQLQTIIYEVLDQNIENRVEIQALDHGIKATDFKIKAEERWWIPKVQAQTSVSYFGLFNNNISTSKELLPNTGKKLDLSPAALNILPIFQAGIGFKWDVLDGNEGKYQVEKAKIEKEILENKKRDASKKLNLNLANNQTNYTIANAQIKLKEKSREIAKQGLEQVEKEFRYGTKTSSALIDAENDLENAELEYQNAIFNQRRSAIELMKSTQNLQIEKL
ncbi:MULTISPECIES: TolC family protein [unclassified Kaistella]|uniref:TolC family protein n=1 Tax=unclassified Kaistella TaxID=2762626 RepID=UPI00273435E6|nr:MULTISPECIES: TolC family protein [unclassified Kaistella]MDP2454596.1 TolC family protein [Kaistella sp. SH11-4b]MDP2457333.1 TolC family protein [Kaistella sp. SH40-3]MDP2460093.1 TolC family protein [Kaistella sp. SH19-2b]